MDQLQPPSVVLLLAKQTPPGNDLHVTEHRDLWVDPIRLFHICQHSDKHTRRKQQPAKITTRQRPRGFATIPGRVMDGVAIGWGAGSAPLS